MYVYICGLEGAAVGEEWSNRCHRLAKCLAIAAATGFKTVFTRIEQVQYLFWIKIITVCVCV